MKISSLELEHLFRLGAEFGATAALIKTGQLKPYLNKNEAFRLYGRKSIEKWIESGLLAPRKDGDFSATWRIDRLDLFAIANSFQIQQYLDMSSWPLP